MQGQTLAACSAGTAGAAPYLQYAVTEDDHLVVTGGSQGAHSSGKLSRHRLRLPKAWGALQVRPCHAGLKLACLRSPSIAGICILSQLVCEDSKQPWLRLTLA